MQYVCIFRYGMDSCSTTLHHSEPSIHPCTQNRQIQFEKCVNCKKKCRSFEYKISDKRPHILLAFQQTYKQKSQRERSTSDFLQSFIAFFPKQRINLHRKYIQVYQQQEYLKIYICYIANNVIIGLFISFSDTWSQPQHSQPTGNTLRKKWV